MFGLLPKHGVALAIATTTLLSPLAAAAAPNVIEIDNFDFAPMVLSVAVGTKVTWVNHDDIPHTVRSADEPVVFKSPPLDTDDSFSFVFMKPGVYRYFCSIHPRMKAEIDVK